MRDVPAPLSLHEPPRFRVQRQLCRPASSIFTTSAWPFYRAWSRGVSPLCYRAREREGRTVNNTPPATLHSPGTSHTHLAPRPRFDTGVPEEGLHASVAARNHTQAQRGAAILQSGKKGFGQAVRAGGEQGRANLKGQGTLIPGDPNTGSVEKACEGPIHRAQHYDRPRSAGAGVKTWERRERKAPAGGSESGTRGLRRAGAGLSRPCSASPPLPAHPCSAPPTHPLNNGVPPTFPRAPRAPPHIVPLPGLTRGCARRARTMRVQPLCAAK